VPGSAAAIYWEDLDTGDSVAIGADRVFKAASLIKLPVAVAILDLWEREPAKRTPERQSLLWRMIAESNNEALDALAEHLGGLSAVNRFCREHGWRDTAMNAYYRDFRHPPGANLTSARDMATILRGVDRRQLISPAASDSLWRLLCDQTRRQRIPAGIPADAGAQVGNKTGTMKTVLHDVAIVRSPGAHYLLCILTANQRSDAAGNAFCRSVSQLVWEAVARPSG
jgi:beta-lactamase class A